MKPETEEDKDEEVRNSPQMKGKAGAVWHRTGEWDPENAAKKTGKGPKHCVDGQDVDAMGVDE